MASKDAGRRLTAEEEREVSAYSAAGVSLPEKYEGLMFENVDGDAHYRYPTDAERKAADEAAAAAAKDQAEAVALRERVTKEAASRGETAPPPPPMPTADEAVARARG